MPLVEVELQKACCRVKALKVNSLLLLLLQIFFFSSAFSSFHGVFSPFFWCLSFKFGFIHAQTYKVRAKLMQARETKMSMDFLNQLVMEARQ